MQASRERFSSNSITSTLRRESWACCFCRVSVVNMTVDRSATCRRWAWWHSVRRQHNRDLQA